MFIHHYEDSARTGMRILNAISNNLYFKDLDKITVNDVVKHQHKLARSRGVGRKSWDFLCTVLRHYGIEIEAQFSTKKEYSGMWE
jgi:hypothetical protein